MAEIASEPPPDRQIALRGAGIYHGPSPYAQQPAIAADLTIGDAAAKDAPAIIEAVKEHFPDWNLEEEPPAANDDRERLASFILVWASEAMIQSPGLRLPFGLREAQGESTRVWIGFHHASVSQLALALAAEIADAARIGSLGNPALATQLKRLVDGCNRYHPRLQEQIVLSAARAARIPYQSAWGFARTWQFGWGSRSELNFTGSPNKEGIVTVELSTNKQAAKAMIAGLGLPTPRSVVINRPEEIDRAVASVGFPCVVKPIDGYGGRGVSANLQSCEQVREAFALARNFAQGAILIEEFVPGDDYRIYLLNGSHVYTMGRRASSIIGDGTHNIQQLIAKENEGRVTGGRVGMGRFGYIEVDEAVRLHLSRLGMSLESIPEQGQEVVLRSNANLSSGGVATSLKEPIHPDVIRACEILAKTLDFSMAGLDYITTDISKSWHDVPGAFIELNQSPVCQILDPKKWSLEEAGLTSISDGVGCIPVDLVIVPDEQLDAAWAHLCDLDPDGHTGLAGHDRANIGPMPLSIDNAARWRGVSTMLAHGAVDKAIILAGSSRIRRYGLPVEFVERAWNCDPALAPEWCDTIAKTANDITWNGNWEEFVGKFRLPEAAEASAS